MAMALWKSHFLSVAMICHAVYGGNIQSVGQVHIITPFSWPSFSKCSLPLIHGRRILLPSFITDIFLSFLILVFPNPLPLSLSTG